MNLSPEVWGPHAWFFIESVCFAYPDVPSVDDKQNIRSFLSLLQSILPCFMCRQNYKYHLTINPITDAVLSSKQNLIVWVVNMHNLVRKLHGKKQHSYDDFMKYYIKQYSKENNSIDGKIYITILFVVLLIIIFILYRNR